MHEKTRYRRALITGASTGLGAAYAEELAKVGCNVVLVARSGDRLKALADGLHSRYSIEATVAPADLGERTGQRRIEELVANDESLDLLINNAGFGTLGKFAELDLEGEMAELALNVTAVVRLTHAALKPMLQRGRGAIVNVASLAAYQPAPYNATYGATKAYLKSFTESLAEEVRGTGVRMQVLCPGFTRTEFQKRAGLDTTRVPGFAWMTAEAVVTASLEALARGTVVCVPGGLYWAMAGVTRTMPESLLRRFMGASAKRMIGG